MFLLYIWESSKDFASLHTDNCPISGMERMAVEIILWPKHLYERYVDQNISKKDMLPDKDRILDLLNTIRTAHPTYQNIKRHIYIYDFWW